MNIGIIGSGDVAKALATGFVSHGHDVMLGTRDVSKLANFAELNNTIKVGSTSEAAAFGEMAVLAVKGSAAMEALRPITAQLAGKTVIDTTNPIADTPPECGVLTYFTGPNESLLEQLQTEFSDICLVKAFNSVGAPGMIDPLFASGPPTMFIAGDVPEAKQTVTKLLKEVGWDVADMGESIAARAIEPLCMLWCIHGFRNDQWGHAFKLLR